MIVELSSSSVSFPPVSMALAEPNGLLAVGGDLSEARLVSAYRSGIFPWFAADDPILWWAPNPRAVFVPGDIHCSRSLKKAMRRQPWRVTLNRAFEEVIDECATIRAEHEGTWITEPMREAYIELHRKGHAHSVEVWLDNSLVGGLYGVCVGRLFCGESMFHRATNASKVALHCFANAFVEHGGQLIDCQMENPHLTSLGAVPMAREHFLEQLFALRDRPLTDDFWSLGDISRYL